MRRKKLIGVYLAGQWWILGHLYRRADLVGGDEDAKVVDVEIHGTNVVVKFKDRVEIGGLFTAGGAMWRDVPLVRTRDKT